MVAESTEILAPVLAHRLHEEGAGHHQGLLVGQQDALAGTHRSHGGRKPGGADDGCHHAVGIGVSGHFAQGGLASHDASRAAVGLELSGQLAGGGLVHHDGEAGREFETVAQHGLHAAGRGQRQHLPAPRIVPQYLERTLTDGAGGSQNHQVMHQNSRCMTNGWRPPQANASG